MNTDQEQPSVSQQQESQEQYLLAYDRQENKVKGVKGIDEQHNLQTDEPTSENQKQFVKIDRTGNFFTNFGKNFLKEFKHPTRFILYKIPENTPPEEAARQIETVQTSEDNDIRRSLNNKRIYNKQRFNPCEIPWEIGARYGIEKESLEKSLDQLCAGEGSLRTVKVKMSPDSDTPGEDARVFLIRDESGHVTFDIHFVKQELSAGMTYRDYTLTQADVDALNQTCNLGHLIELTVDKETGEKRQCFLSKDPLTNELYHLQTDKLTLKRTVRSQTFDPKQFDALWRGEEVGPCQFRSNNGRIFESSVQVNAQKRKLEFLFNRGTKQVPKVSDNDQKQAQIKFH